MKYKLLSLLIFLSLCLPLRAANIDYRALNTNQFTTNIPSAYYVGIKGYGVTNVPATNVQYVAGSGITFTTNNASITITATGTNQTLVTNVIVRAGTNIVVSTNGPTDWTINAVDLWQTNAADGSITNVNNAKGVARVSSTNAVLELDNRGTGTLLLNGQSNRTTTIRIRDDGSHFIGRHVDDVLDTTDFGSVYPLFQASLIDSNEPALANFTMRAQDAANTYYGATVGSISVNKTNPIADFSMDVLGTNGFQKTLEMQIKLTNGFVKLSDSGGTLFNVNANNGDLTYLKSVQYSWPATNGSANQVLMTDGAVPQQLSWTAFIKALVQGTNVVLTTNGNVITVNSTAQSIAGSNFVAVAAGTNITAVTNGGLVTISVSNTNLPVVVAGTNVTVQTNGLAYTVNSSAVGGAANIGPGTTNYIAKFTSTTNVGDSIVVEEATNQWAWRSRPTSTPYTNSITNILYHEWTAANNFKALEISTPANDNDNVKIRQHKGSAVTQVFTGMTLNDAWTINGLGTVAAGGHNGDLLPEADSDGSTGLTVGNGSHRIKNITAWQLIMPDQSGTTSSIDGSTYAQQFKSTGVYWYEKAGPNQMLSIIKPTGPGLSLNLSHSYLATSAGQNDSVDTFMRRGNEANTWTFTTNSGANTAPVSRLTGAESDTTDKPGGDIVILGGRSKGTGLPGAVRVQTVEPAAASSSSINDNKTDRVYIAPRAVSLTTNSATTVFNFTVPATLNVVGARVFATTRITDGTEVASASEEFAITALRKVNTVTCTNSTSVLITSLGTGSAAVANTWTVVPNAQSVDVKLNCVTSGITSTNSTVRWRVEYDSDAVPVTTPQ